MSLLRQLLGSYRAFYLSTCVLVLAGPKIKMLASGDACPDCGLAGLSIDHPITDPSFPIQL